jgi:quercetin dioxygenase-like cupin family protein
MACHTHPFGQRLVVGHLRIGWMQCWGSPKQEIHAGGCGGVSSGEKHWQGATPTAAMSHIAVQESLNGKPVDWLEHVTDKQYPAVSVYEVKPQ